MLQKSEQLLMLRSETTTSLPTTTSAGTPTKRHSRASDTSSAYSGSDMTTQSLSVAGDDPDIDLSCLRESSVDSDDDENLDATEVNYCCTIIDNYVPILLTVSSDLKNIPFCFLLIFFLNYFRSTFRNLLVMNRLCTCSLTQTFLMLFISLGGDMSRKAMPLFGHKDPVCTKSCCIIRKQKVRHNHRHK